MFRAVFAARTWLETAYLLLDLVVGVAGFTLVGIPILVLTLLGCRGAAWLERRRARILGLDLPDPPPLDSSGSFLRRASRPLVDGIAWRSAAYLVLMLPVGIVTFTVVV